MKENTKAIYLEDAIRKISLERIAHPDEIAMKFYFYALIYQVTSTVRILELMGACYKN